MKSLADKIKEDILRGKLYPGQKLKILHLRTAYQVGSTPLREAISQLLETDLIVSKPNKGFYVKLCSQEDLKDLIYSFAYLEVLLLAEAIKVGDNNWESHVMAQLYLIEKVENQRDPINFEDWEQLNESFHLALISACPFRYLLKAREKLYLQFKRYIRLAFEYNDQPISANYREHQEIAEASISRKKGKAKELLFQHIVGGFSTIVRGIPLD